MAYGTTVLRYINRRHTRIVVGEVKVESSVLAAYSLNSAARHIQTVAVGCDGQLAVLAADGIHGSAGCYINTGAGSLNGQVTADGAHSATVINDRTAAGADQLTRSLTGTAGDVQGTVVGNDILRGGNGVTVQIQRDVLTGSNGNRRTSCHINQQHNLSADSGCCDCLVKSVIVSAADLCSSLCIELCRFSSCLSGTADVAVKAIKRHAAVNDFLTYSYNFTVNNYVDGLGRRSTLNSPQIVGGIAAAAAGQVLIEALINHTARIAKADRAIGEAACRYNITQQGFCCDITQAAGALGISFPFLQRNGRAVRTFIDIFTGTGQHIFIAACSSHVAGAVTGTVSLGRVHIAVGSQGAVHTQDRTGEIRILIRTYHTLSGGRVANGICGCTCVVEGNIAGSDITRCGIIGIICPPDLIIIEIQRTGTCNGHGRTLVNDKLHTGQQLHIVQYGRGAGSNTQRDVAVDRQIQYLGVHGLAHDIQIQGTQIHVTVDGIFDLISIRIIQSGQCAGLELEQAGTLAHKYRLRINCNPALRNHIRRDSRIGLDFQLCFHVLHIILGQGEDVVVSAVFSSILTAQVAQLEQLPQFTAALSDDLAAGISAVAVSADNETESTHFTAAGNGQLRATLQHRQAITQMGGSGITGAGSENGTFHAKNALDRQIRPVFQCKGAERLGILNGCQFVVVLVHHRIAGNGSAARTAGNHQALAGGDFVITCGQSAITGQNDSTAVRKCIRKIVGVIRASSEPGFSILVGKNCFDSSLVFDSRQCVGCTGRHKTAEAVNPAKEGCAALGCSSGHNCTGLNRTAISNYLIIHRNGTQSAVIFKCNTGIHFLGEYKVLKIQTTAVGCIRNGNDNCHAAIGSQCVTGGRCFYTVYRDL